MSDQRRNRPPFPSGYSGPNSRFLSVITRRRSAYRGRDYPTFDRPITPCKTYAFRFYLLTDKTLWLFTQTIGLLGLAAPPAGYPRNNAQ
jgi:hypothetical protein